MKAKYKINGQKNKRNFSNIFSSQKDQNGTKFHIIFQAGKFYFIKVQDLHKEPIL